MKPFLLFLPILILSFITAQAGRISGTVTDERGNLLPFASILVKGTTKGTTANTMDSYFIKLDNQANTLLFASMWAINARKKLSRLQDEDIQLDFQLSLQELSMAAVVVRPGGEDPAYEIIRNAIKKREYYLNQLDKFQCEVYIKGQLRLRDFPKKFLGQTDRL